MRIEARREQLRTASNGTRGDPQAPVIGLALSGGGIRSATFSLGMLRELGKLNLLHRFDYLSTVSGGSYVGSYYCALFASRSGADAVLSASDFPDPFDASAPAGAESRKLGAASLDWLRQSGRYLAPQGAGDYWYALGMLIRNWIGVHVVIGSIVMTLALLAVGFRALMFDVIWPLSNHAPSLVLEYAPLLMLLAVPTALHVWCGWAFWLTRRGNTGDEALPSMAIFGTGVLGAAAFIGAYCYPPAHVNAAFQVLSVPRLLCSVGIAAWGAIGVLGIAYVRVKPADRWLTPRELIWDRCRKKLTEPLLLCAGSFAAILGVAAADSLGYFLYVTMAKGMTALLASPLAAVGLVPATRWLLPRLIQLAGSKPGPADKNAKGSWVSAELLYKVGAALAALALILAVAMFWVILAYKATWPLMPANTASLVAKAEACWVDRSGDSTSRDGAFSCEALPQREPAPQKAGSGSRMNSVPQSAATTPAREPEQIVTVLSPLDGFSWLVLSRPETAPKVLAEPTLPSCSLPKSDQPYDRCAFLVAGVLPWPVVGIWCAWLGGLAFVWLGIALTPSFINLSSLISFYAGRLRRAYLGAGNRNRITHNRARTNLTTSSKTGKRKKRRSIRTAVDQSDESDEVTIEAYYTPSAAPLHLINVTLNETRGKGSNVVQRDRHGRNLVISPSGIYHDSDGRDRLSLIDYKISRGRKFVSAEVADAIVIIQQTLANGQLVEERLKGDLDHAEIKGVKLKKERTTDGKLRNVIEGGEVVKGRIRGRNIVGGRIVGGTITGGREPSTFGHEDLPLSTWIAISGAAFSTGLGGRTGFPLSQLALLANVRLGYWWQARKRQLRGKRLKIWTLATRAWAADRFRGPRPQLFDRRSTQGDLLREFRGDFPGPSEDYWYLSDGGHFENTGAYELIRRRLPLIVVSDNGQDARFEYEDVANLVRKARIDFGCDIEFKDDQALDTLFGQGTPLRKTFANLREISGDQRVARTAVAALAHVRYQDGDASTSGTLILIKPRFTGDGPADLFRYKAANATFPQQSTIDQFFDEAQWESYYYLGRLICRSVFGTPSSDPSRWHPGALSPLFSDESPA